MNNTEEFKLKETGKLLNTLRSIQDNLGYIPQKSINELCKSFNLLSWKLPTFTFCYD